MPSDRDCSQFQARYQLGYSEAKEEQRQVSALNKNVPRDVLKGGNAETLRATEEQAWAIPKSGGLERPFSVGEEKLPMGTLRLTWSRLLQICNNLPFPFLMYLLGWVVLLAGKIVMHFPPFKKSLVCICTLNA